MPIIQGKTSVAANTTTSNVVAGNFAEFIAEDSIVSFYACASSAGLYMTAIVGDEVVIDDMELNTQNRMPVVPDDLLIQAGGFAGDRIVIRFRNSTGSAITAFYRVDIEPV